MASYLFLSTLARYCRHVQVPTNPILNSIEPLISRILCKSNHARPALFLVLRDAGARVFSHARRRPVEFRHTTSAPCWATALRSKVEVIASLPVREGPPEVPGTPQ